MAHFLFRNITKSFTVGVLVVMVIAVIILRIVQDTPTPEEQVQTQQQQLQAIDAVLEQLTPGEETLKELLRPRLEEEEIVDKEVGFIARDGQPIRGLLAKPEGSGPFPAVVIVPDGSSDERVADFAQSLGEELMETLDVLTLTVDWREGELGGDDLTDVVSALDWVQLLTEVSDQPVFLLGMGRGAYLSLVASQEFEGGLDGVIVVSGYIDPLKEYEHLSEYNAEAAEQFLEDVGCEGEERESCLENFSLTGNLTITAPLLILHSKADLVIPIEQSEQLASLVAEELLTFHILDDPAVGHDFLSDSSLSGFEEGIRLIREWLSFGV